MAMAIRIYNKKMIKNNEKQQKKEKTRDFNKDKQERIKELKEEIVKAKSDEIKTEEPKTEELDIVEGMVYCKNCKEEVEPYPVEHNRWRCPSCQKYTQSPDMTGKDTEQLKEVKPSKDRPYEIVSSRNIKFSGNELAQAEMLIESGVAKNFGDLAKKAFNILFLKEKVNKAFGTDINKMELNKKPNPEMTTKEPDPGRALKQIQEGELYQAQIDNMKKGGSTDDTSEIIDKSQKQQLVQAQIDNMKKGGSQQGGLDPLSIMMVMKMMDPVKPQADVALQREVADLKQQMQMQQMLNQHQQQQQQQQQGQQSSQQFMQEIEKIRSERDRSIKQAEIATQKERDKNLQLAFENRRIDLENKLKAIEKETKGKGSGQITTQRVKEMTEEIAAIKEFFALIGDREKGTGEMIVQGLGNIADKAGPAFIELLKQRKEQATIPQQLPPPAEQLPPQVLKPPTPNLDEPLPPSDMTATEKEMSDQMSDMYGY